jgi:hypothetical protein
VTRGLRWRVLLRSRYLQEMSPVTIEDCDGAFKTPRTIGCVGRLYHQKHRRDGSFATVRPDDRSGIPPGFARRCAYDVA